jgi:hypothetical protein
MNRPNRRLPIPQWEFGFTPDTFNLIAETGIDCERIAADREQVEKERGLADTAQTMLFQTVR